MNNSPASRGKYRWITFNLSLALYPLWVLGTYTIKPSSTNTFRIPPFAVLRCQMLNNSGARGGCPPAQNKNTNNCSWNWTNFCSYWVMTPPFHLIWPSGWFGATNRLLNRSSLYTLFHNHHFPLTLNRFRISCKNDHPTLSSAILSLNPAQSKAGTCPMFISPAMFNSTIIKSSINTLLAFSTNVCIMVWICDMLHWMLGYKIVSPTQS